MIETVLAFLAFREDVASTLLVGALVGLGGLVRLLFTKP